MKELHELIHKNDALLDKIARKDKIVTELLSDLQNAKFALEEREPPRLHVVSALLDSAIDMLSEEIRLW
jgi:hypothetical protein